MDIIIKLPYFTTNSKILTYTVNYKIVPLFPGEKFTIIPKSSGINNEINIPIEGNKYYKWFPLLGKKIFVKIPVKPWPVKEIPVKVMVKGNVASGFKLGTVIAEPQKIRVSGLPQVISKIKEVSTECIDISGLKNGKTLKVPLAIKENDDMFFEVKEVQATITILHLPNEEVTSGSSEVKLKK